MKHTLRELLEQALKDIEYEKGRKQEIQKRLDIYEEKEKNRYLAISQENHKTEIENKNLLEIIRWHINPETAKYPFFVEKSQRDGRNF